MNNLTLVEGVGDGKTTACVMSLASILANEPLSDSPACVCPIVRKLCIHLNDGHWWDSDEERTKKLWLLAQRILGSKSTLEVEAKRVRECVFTAVRIFAPAALRAGGLDEQARALEALPDTATYDELRKAANNAAAYAANNAAAYAAYADDRKQVRRALKGLILRCLEIKS